MNKKQIDKANKIKRLKKGNVAPSFQASSEKEIGTANAKAPIDI